MRIDKDEVLVDIGYKSEGVIPANELSIRKSVDPHDEVHLGEEVDAIVLTKEDQDGRLIMSKKRARFEKAWRRIEAAAESGEPVEGTVIEVVKGGLIIDLGVRGFLPASLVDIRRVPNLDEYMGTKIETKVIELNRSRNNVVLSRRAVLEEERKEVRQQILDRLQPGLVVEGQISNIVDFGAFVDLDGIDGLIHISELSWSHVNHPSEILEIGDTVQVKVLDIDRDRQRISLGLKQTQEDPWQRIVDTYNVGDELEGKVTKVVTFGAFVEILDGVEGLVHISELAPHHVESPREIVQPGDEIRVKILEIDSERRRLSLSAKRVEDQILPLRRPGEPRAPQPTTLEDEPRRGADRRGRRAERAGCRAPSREAAAPEQRPHRSAEPPSRAARRQPRRGRASGRAGRQPRSAPRLSRASEAAASRRPRPRPRQQPPRPTPEAARAATSRRRGRRRCRRRAAGRAAGRRRARAGLTAASVARGREAGGAVRRADRRAWARASRPRWALERLGAAVLSTDAVVHELYGGDASCATPSSSAGATRSRPAASSTARRSPRGRSPTTRSAPGSRGCSGRWSARASPSGSSRRARRSRAPRGRGGRGAAAVRGRPGGALRRDDRGRRRRGAARASAPRRAGTRSSTSAPRASCPGGEGAPGDIRRAQRRHRARSCERELSAVLDKLRG